ncbi:MAG: branched-chain amino acid ABC transporter permease [Pseudorhodoplanes sp.]|nr:branched-chain amino acid ABC transporter permease [Pseudorhodoplanes sp.]
MTRLVANQYYYFAGYIVLQYVVLASAWNILGGYAGYVNFGTSAFFALGAYTSIVLLKIFELPLPLLILGGAIISGVVGLGTAYLTLRLRGIFFAIATLALSVVLETFIVNWNFVGGASGIYITRPQKALFFDDYIKLLFVTMLLLAIAAAAIARSIERSRLGRGLAAIRDNELAAEAMGVPTLRLKVIATITSGMLMGAAGAPFPYYLTYIQPASVFSLEYTVNSIAMPLIGGTTTWIGPVIGAVILGVAQQITTVTVSSELNLMIVGALLIAFVILAPKGIVGFLRSFVHLRN